MNQITTFEQADARAKELIPTKGNVEATVSTEPEVYEGKSFWRVLLVDSDLKETVKTYGNLSYIADNGKSVTISSNPLIESPDDRAISLLEQYDN